MKVVINKRFGGFTLNRGAYNTLINKGEIKVTAGGNVVPILNDRDAYDCEYLRYNQTLISMIEEGYDCSGSFSKLRVVEIPDEATDYMINEYDGSENVIYVLNGKLHTIS